MNHYDNDQTVLNDWTAVRVGRYSTEVGRYSNEPRENRLCKCCTQNVVESEYHFLLCCPLYRSIRQKLIGSCSWPNENKFIQIMSSKTITNLIKLSRYIRESTNLRKIVIENMPVSWSQIEIKHFTTLNIHHDLCIVCMCDVCVFAIEFIYCKWPKAKILLIANKHETWNLKLVIGKTQ